MKLSWQQPHQHCNPPSQPCLRHWLLYAGSMTARMKSVSKTFRIELLTHRFQQPTLSEAHLLNLKPHQLASIREVVIHCDGLPWLYARAVIPRQVLTGRGRRLHYLGTTPLGRMLFQELQLNRSEFSITQMRDPVFLRDWSDGKKPLWARRCQFHGLQAPILLYEIFLPAMENKICSKP